MFPVLRILGDTFEDVTIETRPCRKKQAYVALSHVWADGLGNPAEMALPRCQILELRDLISKLQVMPRFGEEETEGQELLLWCDTVCCSIEAEPKRLALAQMAAVYAEAAYVLVSDRTLSAYAYDEISPIEAAVRIFTSPWYRRIWTLQEASLAGHLLIQFADRAVDLRRIQQALEGIWDHDSALAGICSDLRGHCWVLRDFSGKFPDNFGSDLANAVEAVRFRRVSVAEDEPLCLNTVLRFPPHPMVDVPKEQRMGVLWKTMPIVRRGIPKGIIFSKLPRLQSLGLHWAPATVQQSTISLPQLTIAHEDIPAAKDDLTESGLKIHYPA